MDRQPVADTAFHDLGIGGVERYRTLILSKSAIATFVNERDESPFQQTGKTVFFEVCGNNGKGKGNRQTSFNQKEDRKTAVIKTKLPRKYARWKGLKRGMVGNTGLAASISRR